MSTEADPRRAPQDFLPEARRILAQPAGERPHPAALAEFDQQDAATRAIVEQLAKSPATESLSPAMPTERSVALLLAMEAAGKRRARHYCSHLRLDAPLAQQGAFVSLSAGIVACNAACVLSIVDATGYDEDGRCDLCDRPSATFHEDTMTQGGLILSGHLCPNCHQWIDGES